MQSTRAATRYAKSLLGLALERDNLNEAFADMQVVADACEESHELELLLKSPIIKTDKKQTILKLLFGDKVTEMTMSFIDIITVKRRERLLPMIAESFIRQYKSNRNIHTARVSTAMPLDKDVRNRIMTLLKEGFGGDIELEEEVDQELIGGFVLRMGDSQVNSSIKHKLAQLGRNFSDNPYIKEY